MNAESISTAGRLGSEQTARCGCLPRAAISTSGEWAAIGEVAPLLLAAGTPKAPHLRIHTIQYESINRTDPSTVVGYRSSSRSRVIEAFDLAGHHGTPSRSPIDLISVMKLLTCGA